jgi:hypothetical protein
MTLVMAFGGESPGSGREGVLLCGMAAEISFRCGERCCIEISMLGRKRKVHAKSAE